jgi:hypothetical protein
MSKSKIHLLFAVTLVLGLSIAAAAAEDRGASEVPTTDLPVLLETIRANRKALVAVNLGLSPEEAAKFWPVYDRYQQEISATGDRLSALIEDYAANFRTLSNEKGLELIGTYLATEAERIKVRQTYVAEFAKILPGRTVARFYQIENKMDAVLRYDIAASIPVIEERTAAPGK